MASYSRVSRSVAVVCSALVLASRCVAAQEDIGAVAEIFNGMGIDGSSSLDVVVKVDGVSLSAGAGDDNGDVPIEDLLPNINMVGMSYDLLRGNPHPTGGGLDPGWRFELFEINYENNDTMFSGAQEYRVPDGVQVTSCPVCSMEVSSSSALSAKDFTSSLHVNVQVGGRARGKLFSGSFKASADVQSVRSRSSQSNNFFIESNSECAFYCPRIRFHDAPRLSPQFYEAVASLPTTYDEDAYDQFLQLFGTHFAIGLTMGGTFGVRHEISDEALQTMGQLGVNVQASASFSAMSFSGSASVLTDVQKDQAAAFSQRTESQSTFSFGGQPIGNPQDPADASLWLDAVREDPLPIRYELADIADLLTSQFFPDDADIAQKRAHLLASTDGYCERLEEQDEISVCEEAVSGGDAATDPYEGADCVTRVGYYDVQGTTQEFDTLTWQECQTKCQGWLSCAGWRWTHNYHPSAKRTCTIGSEIGSSWNAIQDSVFCAGKHCLDCTELTGKTATDRGCRTADAPLSVVFPLVANTRCCFDDGGECASFCNDGVPVTYTEAEAICANASGRLCTYDELESSTCCGTGCSFDSANVWISDRITKKFVLSEERTYWANARAHCESTGGRLPSIHSLAENHALTMFARSETTATDVWIGGNDIELEGAANFQWSDGTALDFTYWRAGEPNNSGNEDCMVLEIDTTLNQWDDRSCTDADNRAQFVCEYDASKVSDNVRFLAAKVGPSGNLLQDSFDDFYQWDQIARPALTEIRVRVSTFVQAIQAVYGPYALTEHGNSVTTPDVQSFKLEPREHIVSVEACYMISTSAGANNIRGLRFRTSKNRESPFYGSYNAAAPGCTTLNFPSRLLYISGNNFEEHLRTLTFHHQPRSNAN